MMLVSNKKSVLLLLAVWLCMLVEDAKAYPNDAYCCSTKKFKRNLALDFEEEDEDEIYKDGESSVVTTTVDTPSKSSGVRGRRIRGRKLVEDEMCCGGADDFDFFMQEIDLFGKAIQTARDGYSRVPDVCDSDQECLDAQACLADCEAATPSAFLVASCIGQCGGSDTCSVCENECRRSCREQCRAVYNGYEITIPGNGEILLEEGYQRYLAYIAVLECVHGNSCDADGQTPAQRLNWCIIAKNYWEPEYECVYEVDVSFECKCASAHCDIGPYECPATADECPPIISGGRSASPSAMPSEVPSFSPSDSPSASPSASPTDYPSASPSESPTGTPSVSPTSYPTPSPSESPTSTPSVSPTKYPTYFPTHLPTNVPTNRPTPSPTGAKTYVPGNPNCVELGYDYGYKFDGCPETNGLFWDIFSGSSFPGPPGGCVIPSEDQTSQFKLSCGKGNDKDKAWVTTTVDLSTYTKGGTGGTLQHTGGGSEFVVETGGDKGPGISHFQMCFCCDSGGLGTAFRCR